jgi:hypothetical protein
MENKQTAVEWLASQLFINDRARYNGVIEEAKIIEKGQIMDAYCEGVNDLDNIEEGSNIDWIGYYNKTYGK